MSFMEKVGATTGAAYTIGLPICSTMTFDTERRSMMGVTPSDFVKFAMVQGADFIGASCGVASAGLLHSEQEILIRVNDIPVVATGNCGILSYQDGAMHDHGTPELMAEYVLFVRDFGVEIIRGCYGTSPAYVAAMVNAFKSRTKSPFGPAAMTTALETVWDDVDTSGGGNAPRGGRKGRRR